jgi:uncharacterized protein (TIGR02453 family)
MLKPSTLKFLKDLEKNNNKPWFELHRTQFEDAKLDFLSSVDKIIHGIATFDAPIGELEAKNCTFRINRDVRFSKDKRPYKSNIAAYFNKAGKKGNGAGYYLHIQPGKSFLAGGIWQPETADLAKIRQEIDYNFDEWKKIIGTRAFKSQFEKGIDTENSLTRPPKGYSEDNPALQYIKMRHFVVRHPLSDTVILSKAFVKEVLKGFQAMKPMVSFINEAVE